MSMFKKAKGDKVRFRAGLIGPSGSGKTFTALRWAHALGSKIAFLDSDRKDGEEDSHIYGDEINPDTGAPFNFDVCHVSHNDPRNYIKGIQAAEDTGYDVVIIDTLSHAWSGKGGALELKDTITKKSRGGNGFNAWGEVSPIQNELIDKILTCRCHVICTLRVKTEYVQEKDEKTGKTVIRKVGTAPVQRSGMEYEFDFVGDMEDNELVESKTRFSSLKNLVVREPGAEVIDMIRDRLDMRDTASVPTPVREPPKAEEPEHDPSFDAKERKSFMAFCKDLGYKYDDVKARLDQLGKPKPSAMPQDQRDKLRTWLVGEAYKRDEPEYIAMLKKLGLTEEQAAEFATKGGLPHPKTMTATQRGTFATQLVDRAAANEGK